MALQIAALNDPTRGGGRHGSAAARAAARRTTEAEESRLTSKYEHALLFMRDGALEDAERELRSILDHDMMSGPPNHRPVEEYPAPPPKPTRDAEDSDTDDNSEYESEDDTPEMTLTSTMTQVKFLALKNLGRLVAERAERREKESRRDDDDDDTRANLDADFALALRCYAAAVEIDGTDASLWRRLGALAASRRLPHVARYALERGLAIAPKHPLMLEDLAETLLAVGDLDACAHIATLLRKVDPGHARAARMRDDPGGVTPLAKFSRAAKLSSSTSINADDAGDPNTRPAAFAPPRGRRATRDGSRKNPTRTELPRRSALPVNIFHSETGAATRLATRQNPRARGGSVLARYAPEPRR